MRGAVSTSWRGKLVAHGDDARAVKRCPSCKSQRLFFDKITTKALDQQLRRIDGKTKSNKTKEHEACESPFPHLGQAAFA